MQKNQVTVEIMSYVELLFLVVSTVSFVVYMSFHFHQDVDEKFKKLSFATKVLALNSQMESKL